MSDTSPRADRKITAVWRVSGADLRMRQTSKPSMPGIITSSRMRSGLARRAISSAVTPSRAARMRWPLPWSVRTRTCRLVALSSTTRIVDGGASGSGRVSVSIAGLRPRFERGRQFVHAGEINIRREPFDAAAERRVALVAGGERVGDRLEIA